MALPGRQGRSSSAAGEVGTEQVTAYGPGETFQSTGGHKEWKFSALQGIGKHHGSYVSWVSKAGLSSDRKSEGQHTAWTEVPAVRSPEVQGTALGSRE